MYCTIYVMKTKALISCRASDLDFVFAYAKSRFSHDAAQMIIWKAQEVPQ